MKMQLIMEGADRASLPSLFFGWVITLCEIYLKLMVSTTSQTPFSVLALRLHLLPLSSSSSSPL